MAYETLVCRIEDNIAIVTFNQPKTLNALNTKMCLEIVQVCSRLAEDDNVRVAIFTGSGKSFVAGADLAEMQPMNTVEAMAFLYKVKAAFTAIDALPQPTIAAVNGFAFGGGNELALACDMRIASESAQFGQQEINMGIIPGGGGTQRLPRLVGFAKSMELALTGDAIDAQEAYRIGLANRLVPAESLMDETMVLAQKLAKKPKIALTQAKEAVKASRELSLASGLEFEIRSCALLWSPEDQKEGMKAFLERRKPAFGGR